MPNRIIKDSICTSDSLDSLSDFHENFFYRLIVSCDDYGLMDARPAILKARLYPLRELTTEDVEGALSELERVGCIERYEVDGKPYLRLPTWETHQSIRAHKPKYPHPVGYAPKEKKKRRKKDADENIGMQMNADEIRCMQMNADAPVIQSNPIQSESESNPNPIPPKPPRGAGDTGFDRFWDEYPKKTGKQAALKAWSRLKPNIELTQAILSAVSAQKTWERWTKENGRFIPNPATWLNQGRWEDRPDPGDLIGGDPYAEARANPDGYFLVVE